MDVKLQVYVGPAGPDKVDFRVSTGGFVGAPEDNHRTVVEARVTDEDLVELGLTENDLIETLATANKVLHLTAPTNLGVLFGLPNVDQTAKLAIRVYDED